MQKTVVLGVSGGIAAFKVLDLIDLLQKKNVVVEVILTHSASFFVDKKEIEAKIRKKVYTDLFENPIKREEILNKRHVEHIDLADKADLFVVVPATANILAKIVHGFADDYLTTTLLAVTCPVIVCPSMNVHMWENPLTQKNIASLLSNGIYMVKPDTGLLACGYKGQGRLADITIIAQEIFSQLQRKESMRDKKTIVTGGGTKEPIDDVRFVSNKSSGKMSAALSDSLFLRGAEVLYICSEDAVRPRYKAKIKTFTTALELEEILQKEVPKSNIIFHAAAVSDYEIKKESGKISSDKEYILRLSPRQKILQKIKDWNPNIQLIAFKAAWDVSEKKLEELAKEKLSLSHADFLVANDVGKKDRGFAVDTNEVLVVSKNKQTIKIPLASKREIAEKIVDFVMDEMSSWREALADR